MKKKSVVSTAIFAIILVLANFTPFSIVIAQENIESTSWSPSGSFSLSLQEKYIGFNIPEVFHEEPVLWSELIIDLHKGFYIDLWHSVGLDDSDISSNWGDEFDIMAGWKKEFEEFNLGFKASFYNVYPLKKWWSGNFIHLSSSISKFFPFDSNHSLTPSLEVGWIACTDQFEHGAITIIPALNHPWAEPFEKEYLEFNESLQVLWNSGFINTKSKDMSLKYNASLDWKLSKNISLTAPGVAILLPITNREGSRDFDKSFFLSLNFTF